MNIIVTGGSSGIGREVVLLLSKDKKNKIFTLSRRDFLIPPGIQNIRSLRFDLEKGDFQKQLLPETKKHFDSVDVLINNAGMLINKPFAGIQEDEWQSIININLLAPVRLIRLLLPYMGKKSRSHILNIGSIGGIQGSIKYKGLSAYSTSKGALSVLTECLAEEFNDRNIAVNCLALGAVQTEMLAKAFPGYSAQTDAKTIAEFISNFATSGHLYMNGKVIPVSMSNP